MPSTLSRHLPYCLGLLLTWTAAGFALAATPLSLCATSHDGFPAFPVVASFAELGPSAADCDFDSTRVDPAYEPVERYTLQVVVHVIQDSTCTDGEVSDATVQSQIDILNEDFLALAGTPGAEGVHSQIQFQLATTDPEGQPTDGMCPSYPPRPRP